MAMPNIERPPGWSDRDYYDLRLAEYERMIEELEAKVERLRSGGKRIRQLQAEASILESRLQTRQRQIALIETISNTATNLDGRHYLGNGLEYDAGRAVLLVPGGESRPISRHERYLLEVLLAGRGRLVSMETIAGAVWPEQNFISTVPHMIRVLKARLLAKLVSAGAPGNVIVTRPTLGLELAAEETLP